MYTIGLDVHVKRSTFVVLDENGKELMNRTVHGPIDKVITELQEVKQPFQICFEASSGYGYIHDRLVRIARRVVVAHAGKLRLIFRSKRKNDRIDAHKLAKLLYLDEVPPAHVPDADVRAWRCMIEHRHALIDERTRTKNRLRALFRTVGLTPPRGLWTKRGIEWMRKVCFDQPLHAVMRDMFLERLASVNDMLGSAQKELNRIARGHPGVAVLMSIPGVGARTAEAVMAYIDKPQRFGRINRVASYFGLVPCEDSSADKTRMGHITRQGPGTVRKLLTEAAWQAVRRSPQVRAYYERVKRDDPQRKKIAIVATAHYLLRAMQAMLCTGELWRTGAA
jgi:transposase